jgi:chromosome partitioning protein
MGKTIAIATLKGGVGKTTTAVSLSAGLARQGKSVLCVDADSQHSLTVSFGIAAPDKLTNTLATAMTEFINQQESDPLGCVVHNAEGVDVLPSNSQLANVELALVSVFAREFALRTMLTEAKTRYDYIIIDTPPTLGLMTINALSAADSVIIPVAPKFLDALGLELLLKSVAQIKRQLNPNLEIDGILLTMVDRRANLTREVIASIKNAYGDNIKIFAESVPLSVRAAETSANGVSIFKHDPNGKVAAAYSALVEGVLSNG